MRESRLMGEAIARFQLDLTGLTVFTEAASGPFLWTPLLALAAGARKVHALARDSRHGRAEEILRTTVATAVELGLADRLVPATDLRDLGQADLVTNLGPLRPFDRARLETMAPTAVLPLMWETWEHRPSELDLEACEARGILVLGTWEGHPDLAFMDHVGLLVVKLLLEAGLELKGTRVVLAGGGAFAEAAIRMLRPLGTLPSVCCLASHCPPGASWLGASLVEPAALSSIQEADALVFLEHHREDLLLDAEGVARLSDLQPDLRVIHLSGCVDTEALQASPLARTPATLTPLPRTMSLTPAWLGPRPVIELHAAGLKVGEVMARARRRFPDDLPAARREALRHPLCQDFAPAQFPPSRPAQEAP